MSGQPPGDGEMQEFLQTFLDETEEQLDDLVETMLVLEQNLEQPDQLNEAFRLIHSIKGSAGIMGFDQITVLTHHLENRFEQFRSGSERLNDPTMNLVLRCIDFLRHSNARLRDGKQLGSPNELLAGLRELEEQQVQAISQQGSAEPQGTTEPEGTPPQSEKVAESQEATASPQDAPQLSQTTDGPIGVTQSSVSMTVRFREGLQLADLKAKLIYNRVSNVAEVLSVTPNLDAWPEDQSLQDFQLVLAADGDEQRLREVSGVEGVEAIEFVAHPVEPQHAAVSADIPAPVESSQQATATPDSEPAVSDVIEHGTALDQSQPAQSLESPLDPVSESAPPEELNVDQDVSETTPGPTPPQVPEAVPVQAASQVASKVVGKVAETMRVDIDRLDHLMNLTGELVVNRARFQQIANQFAPAKRDSDSVGQLRDFADHLRALLDSHDQSGGAAKASHRLIDQLRDGLTVIDRHSDAWERGRRNLDRFGEAVDQLSRVSQSLQKGVLDTRMTPVSPLFNRFRRVVRDLAKERGKQVELQIRGEKTELDKRMIDELGDPLMHLVRNSVDHGLETTESRRESGKPETGTILLEASHSGNNVFIKITDDGAGIDLDKICAKVLQRGLLSASAINDLADDQILDYIWHPGFSTAKSITDVSGRGVGMDVVRNRIQQLNGSVDVESVPHEGTTFTIRLPLTLAIIHCLLVRLRGVVFAIPIEDVREIVSINMADVVSVGKKQTFELREEFISLVNVDHVFDWNELPVDANRQSLATDVDSNQSHGPLTDVVILQAAGRMMGLAVEEFLGGQDMVIKSLSNNFVEIRGLSGASILGDGSVCLMLDVGTAFQLVIQRSIAGSGKELTS